MKLTLGHGANRHKVIVSLCDYSGNWPKPYADAGYTVIQLDLKHGDDCTNVEKSLDKIWEAINSPPLCVGYAFTPWDFVGVLIATPCTAYTVSGARWWPRHDADGTRAAMDAVARGCLAIKDALKPTWWALENPIGRIAKCVPEVGPKAFTFDPCDYAGLAPEPHREAYTKRTAIYGNAQKPIATARLEPVMVEKVGKNGRVYRGSWMWANLGGKSERTKELRSMTPMGFARAFFEANP